MALPSSKHSENSDGKSMEFRSKMIYKWCNRVMSMWVCWSVSIPFVYNSYSPLKRLYMYIYIYICISDIQLFQWIYDSQYRIFAPMDACYNVLIFLSTEFNILLVASSNKPIFHGSKFDGPLKLSILIVMFSIHPKNIPKTILQDIP